MITYIADSKAEIIFIGNKNEVENFGRLPDVEP
jgi:hypothetical protein